MDYNQLYQKPEEIILREGKASCFGIEDNIDGTLILTNYRIYLQINEEYKINEILLSDIDNITLGGINVLRCELKNGQRTNFLVHNVLGWKRAIKKVLNENRK